MSFYCERTHRNCRPHKYVILSTLVHSVLHLASQCPSLWSYQARARSIGLQTDVLVCHWLVTDPYDEHMTVMITHTHKHKQVTYSVQLEFLRAFDPFRCHVSGSAVHTIVALLVLLPQLLYWVLQ